MFGFFNVNKPAGPTSHDVVAAVRKKLGRRVKLGHAGTLDPFAAGVLVLCAGPATRLARYVQAMPKHYSATVALGATSTTDDPEGPITLAPGAEAPSRRRVAEVVGGFVGEIQQIPPEHSAVHVRGRRAYKLARAGKTVELQPRAVTVHSIGLVKYEYPQLEIDVECDGGTYIRALARDIGAALGVGGYCSRLTRTGIGAFTLNEAVGPDELDPTRDLLGPLTALAAMPKITLDDDSVRKLLLGQRVAVEDTSCGTGELAVLDERGRLIAIGRVDTGDMVLAPVKVFAPAGG